MARLHWTDRVVAAFAPQRGLRRLQARAQLDLIRRSYEASRPGRRTSGWPAPATSANSEILGALPMLRGRARDLTRNNPYAAKGVSELVGAAIGDGINIRPRTGSDRRNAQVAALYREWCHQCDADGPGGMVAVQIAAARSFFESGESLIRLRPRRMNDGLPIPLQLQVIEGDYLDHSKNGDHNGNPIRMGIEFDLIGQRQAYWLFPSHPGERYQLSGSTAADSSPVPASSVVHLYERQRPGQIRGVPWATPSLLAMRDLDDYEVSEQLRKKLEACIAAIILGDEAPEEGGLAPIVRDVAGNAVEQFEPGLIAYAPTGKDVKFTQPAAVGGFDAYERVMQRKIAAGMRVPYELLTGDLSGTNYSSIRAGMTGFRRMVTALQWSVFVPAFVLPVYRTFIDTAILAGKLPASTPYDCEITTPRIEALDPQKEYAALKEAVRDGLMSLPEAISSLGYDPEQVINEIAATNAKLDEFGIVLDTDPRKIGTRGLLQAPAAVAADINGDPAQAQGDQADQTAA